MNTSLIGSWALARLAEAPWGLGLAGRWTALLILAWLGHMVLSRRNPRWRVLLWRSVAVGVAMIAVLSAAPPVVIWRVPRTDAMVVQEVPGPIIAPVVRPEAPSAARSSPFPDRRTSAVGLPTGFEGGTQSRAGSALISKNHAETRLSLGSWLLAIWLAGVGVMAARLGLSLWGLSRVIGRSAPVPAWIVEESCAVAKAVGCRRPIRVVESAEVPTPCVTGLSRPILLLPGTNCEENDRAELRAILTHELAHARNHDLAWNFVLQLASILLWFHPFAWRIRAAHIAACEAVCDAVAADLLGDVALYGRTLARLALQVGKTAPTPGLAMARTPDVFLRIEALQRRVFRRALPWRLIVPALLALGAVVILIGGFGFAGADQPPARKDQPPARKATGPNPGVANAAPDKDATRPASSHRLSLRVLSAKTGEPLDGVSVSWELRGEGKPLEETVTTGKEGTASIEWPPGIAIRFLGLNVKKPGYVGLFLHWDDRNHAISVPESREARLEPGVPIRGVVQDEAGKPIAQASVTPMAWPTGGEEPRYVYELGTARTDELGRWHIDDAPANVSSVSLHVRHPDYRRQPGQGQGGREWRTILSKAATVKGRVVDGSGKPVKGAKVETGGREHRDERTPVPTNELGEYTLRGCEPGPAIVTAQAEGFGPAFQEVNVPNGGEAEAPVIRLGKPSTLRVRIVDRAGKPVADAYLQVGTWRGHESLLRIGAQSEVPWRSTWNAQTDAAGRFTWTSAPSDAMLVHIFKDGYMRQEPVSLTASGQEQVVTLDPGLVISGSVTDAVTGKPVPRFHVIQGIDQLEERKGILAWFLGKKKTIWWWRMGAVEYTGGRYSRKFDTESQVTYVRVEAPGYEPAESRAFRPDEGAMVQDFRLKPAAGISGVVLLPDDRPAAGVPVVLGTQENRAFVRDGVFQDNSHAERITTGPDGRLTVPKREAGFLIVVAADAGFGDATSDEFARTGKLVLQPWGRIEGEVRIGRKPAAYQSVVYVPELPSNRGVAFRMRSYDYHFTADSQGRFAIDRVIPGRGQIARVLNMTLRNEWCGQVPVEVKPGQTTQVRLGGKGRAVVGRVVLDGTPPEPVDWRSNDAAVLDLPRAERRKATTAWRTFASGFDVDGRFRIEDVAPGTYELKIPVSLPSDKRTWGTPRATMGEATLSVTVPEGPDDQPVDVGDVKVRFPVQVGVLAPDFTAPRLDGGPFKLSDTRGKLVLLDFWATWSLLSRAEMPAMKEIQKTFGDDPRFLLVGVSCDEAVEAPAKYTKENALVWTQVYGGKILGGVAETYLIRAIPATFLIAPDGRVLAMNLRGPALQEAVRNALNDQKLFPTPR